MKMLKSLWNFKSLWNGLLDWFRTPSRRHNEVSADVHAEHERRRGMRGWG